MKRISLTGVNGNARDGLDRLIPNDKVGNGSLVFIYNYCGLRISKPLN